MADAVLRELERTYAASGSPDLVDRLNRLRERLGWEPKAFGEWECSVDPDLVAAAARIAARSGVPE